MEFNPNNAKYRDAKFTPIILDDIENNLFEKKLAIIFPK
jgi:hypothetical protein